MSTSSPVNPSNNTPSANPSQENPSPDYTFYLEMKPLRKLRLAIEAMADPGFNELGTGMVIVGDKGFYLKAQNVCNNATAILKMDSLQMIKFRSYNKLFGDLVPFQLISENFPADLNGDDDTVCVFHVRESNNLCFEFGRNPSAGFSVEFVQIGPQASWFPSTESHCNVCLTTAKLREMISYLLEAQDHSNNTVLAEIKEKSASFEIGIGRKWEFVYQNEANVSTGLNARQIHRTWFNLRYITTLMTLSLLTSVFTVVFLSIPERHIRLQFKVKDLGVFSIMIKALLTTSSNTMTDISPDNLLISAEDPAESSSANNQPANYSFYLEMKPLRKLRLAIEALADPAFNNRGIGRVDVDKKGFEINFQNASDATGHLVLNAFGMIRFQSSNPLIGKLVSLASISQSFPSDFDADEDTVHVYHIHGSNELCFKFGTVPPTGYKATFMEKEMDPPIPRFDSLPIFVEIVVPAKDLRQMIEKSMRGKAPHTKSVLLAIKKNIARFETGGSKQWEYDCDKNRGCGSSGMKLSKVKKLAPVWFNWTYNTLLVKASFLEVAFGVCLLLAPEREEHHVSLQNGRSRSSGDYNRS